ncbi:MAG: SDR family NAD(P)-dependent oxidoreductase [Bacteroidales bacterium]
MIKNKTILITGGTGSLGSVLAENLMQENKIVVYSRNEERQFLLKQKLNSENVEFIIGDVRDTDTLKYALRKCNLAIHAAAMKDVIFCEAQPAQTCLNNIEGSRSFIKAADDAGIEKAVGISTDKAASPSNVYGMTKYIMEQLFFEASNYSKTHFVTTRFGNMINSSGSLVTWWKNHPESDIRLTHNDMERFFFTLKDAVNTVVKAFEVAGAGEIYVPKMDKAKIKDILTVITGKNEFEIIGVYPGEKIYEELIGENEKYSAFEYDDYFLIKPGQRNTTNTKAYSTHHARQLSTAEIRKLIYG